MQTMPGGGVELVIDYLSEKLDWLTSDQMLRATELWIPVVDDGSWLSQQKIAERKKANLERFSEISRIFEEIWMHLKTSDVMDLKIKDEVKRHWFLSAVAWYYDTHSDEWDAIDLAPFYMDDITEWVVTGKRIFISKLYYKFPELSSWENISWETLAVLKVFQRIDQRWIFFSDQLQQEIYQYVLARISWNDNTKTTRKRIDDELEVENTEDSFAIFWQRQLRSTEVSSLVHLEELLVILGGDPIKYVGQIHIPLHLGRLFIEKHIELFRRAESWEKIPVIEVFKPLFNSWKGHYKRMTDTREKTMTTASVRRDKRKPRGVAAVITHRQNSVYIGVKTSDAHTIVLSWLSDLEWTLEVTLTITPWWGKTTKSVGRDGVIDLRDQALEATTDYTIHIWVPSGNSYAFETSNVRIASEVLKYARANAPRIHAYKLRNYHTQSLRWRDVISMEWSHMNDLIVYIGKDGSRAVWTQCDLSSVIDTWTYPAWKYKVAYWLSWGMIERAKENSLIIQEKTTSAVTTNQSKTVARLLAPELGVWDTIWIVSWNESRTETIMVQLLDILVPWITINGLWNNGYAIQCELNNGIKVTFIWDWSGQISFDIINGPQLTPTEKQDIIDLFWDNIRTLFEWYRVQKRQEKVARELWYLRWMEWHLIRVVRDAWLLDPDIDMVDYRWKLWAMRINNIFSGNIFHTESFKWILDAFTTKGKEYWVHMRFSRVDEHGNTGTSTSRPHEMQISLSVEWLDHVAAVARTWWTASDIIFFSQGELERETYDRLKNLLLNILLILWKLWNDIFKAQGKWKDAREEVEWKLLWKHKKNQSKLKWYSELEDWERDEIWLLVQRIWRWFGKMVTWQWYNSRTWYYSYEIVWWIGSTGDTLDDKIAAISDDAEIVVRNERIQWLSDSWGRKPEWNPWVYNVLEDNKNLRIAFLYRIIATIQKKSYHFKTPFTNWLAWYLWYFWKNLPEGVWERFLDCTLDSRWWSYDKGLAFTYTWTDGTVINLIERFIAWAANNQQIIDMDETTGNAIYTKEWAIPLVYSRPYLISGYQLKSYYKEMKHNLVPAET